MIKYILISSLLLSVNTHAKRNKTKKNQKKITKKSNWSHQETVGLEMRKFSDDSNDSTQNSNIAFTAGTLTQYKKKHLHGLIDLHLKYDPTDNNRNLLNIKNMYISQGFGSGPQESFEDDLFADELGIDLKEELKTEEAEDTLSVILLAGFKTYHWTNMYTFSPADSINSHIYDGEFENNYKKGELSLALTKKYENGSITGYFFPRIEKPFYSKKHSQTSYGFNFEEPVWLKKNNNVSDSSNSIQAGIRWEHQTEKTDYAIHYIKHTNRDAPIIAYDSTKNTFTPNYFESTEIGILTQFRGTNKKFKFETAVRSYSEFEDIETIYGDRKPENHMVQALGYDQTKKFKSGKALKYIAEIQIVVGLEEEQKQEQYLYQSDLFLGLIYDFNNKRKGKLSTGLIIDLERESEHIFTLQYDQNYRKKWKFSSKVRVTNAPKTDDAIKGAQFFHNTNYLILDLSYLL